MTIPVKMGTGRLLFATLDLQELKANDRKTESQANEKKAQPYVCTTNKNTEKKCHLIICDTQTFIYLLSAHHSIFVLSTVCGVALVISSSQTK